MGTEGAQVIVASSRSTGVKNCYGVLGPTLNTFATYLNRGDIKCVHMRS